MKKRKRNRMLVSLMIHMHKQNLWINNKVLLYSTGDYIQHPVINQNGKEYEKEYMYN